MTDTIEIWKQIPGYPYYDVSNLGNVRSWHYGNTKKRAAYPKILSPGTIGKYGHLGVWLYGKTTSVHQLVMLTFVGPCPEGLEVCHNNGDPADNELENLRYDTHSSNAKDMIAHGRGQNGNSNPMKLTAKQVREIRNIYIKGQKPSMSDLALMYGITKQMVSLIVNRKSWLSQ